MKKLQLWAFTLLLVSTLLPPMRVSIAQLDMGDGATSGDLFDRIPPPITDFFIPAQQVSVGPPTKRSASDFIGRIYAPKPEDWKVRSDARPITGVTVTIKSGLRAGESVITNNSGYYRFPNVRGDELHLRVEKEHFEPKEVIVYRSQPTILANGDVLNYPEDVQQNPGSILMGQSWPDEVRFILEETRVVHDLLYAEGGAPPVGEDIGGFYSRGIIVIYSHQYANWQDSVGVLGTFAHEIAHARQHALVSVDGSAWEIHDWNNTPEGIAYKEAREKDWNEVGKAQLDYGGDRPDYPGNVLTETAAETIAHYWSVDRWGGRPHYGDLRITAPNRFKWAAVWLQKQSERLQPLSKILGDNQTGLSNTPLPLPFAVVVRNLDDGFPLSGVSIMFAVTAGGGTLSATRATTDHTGIAETTLTLGPKIGTNTVSVSAVGIEETVTFNAVATAPVEIPDPNLRAAIEVQLRVPPNTPIAPADMTTLTQLIAHAHAEPGLINNLTGLAHATNLTLLDLGENSVSDFSPLADLTSLEFLIVGRNLEFSDLSPVAGLINLTYLALWENSISDISALVNLTNLRELHLNDNHITDISPVSDLTNLTHLGLWKNNITDISAVAGLTNLTHLVLYINKISDPSPVAGLTDLTSLNLAENSISDISALVNLTNLTHLELPFNSISDLSPLVANTGLGAGDEVDVRGNPLNYLSIMAHIPSLQRRGVTVEFDDTAMKPPDVNGDGNVDVLDLISIASEFGSTGANITADVNRDGVVNMVDLVLVAGTFESAAAAPSTHSRIPETITAVEVRQWLTEARALENRDSIMQRGILVLEQLLVYLTPKETELLANYPNPFNPETWIPYRLAADADVKLTIYDQSGQVVRTIDVGHRIAAVYERQSKAIYWDGRNQVGEQVSSGVYFYHLSAGDYSNTRKMIILK